MILLNGTPLNVTIFPDKTSQIWKLSEFILKETNFAHVVWNFENEGEFMQLAQLKQLLDRYEISVVLTISYLPYGRQDKEVTNTTTFALRTFARLINTLHFQEIIIMDPHSETAIQLINNSRATYPLESLFAAMDATDTDLFCYPDKGAVRKYTRVYEYPSIHGEKVRDQLTGNILSYELIGNPEGRNVLIVDDICDGGMTFKLLAKDLLAAGAKEVNLFVTHGIFSKGIETLKESGIKRVFTQDGEKGSTITKR